VNISKYSLSDAMNPKAIIIGQFDQKSGDTLVSLFNRFSTQIMRMTIEEAEFHKFVHNTFNATKIAFFNEMRIIAEKQQLDPEKIFQSVIVTCEGIWNPEYGTRNWGPFDGSCLTEDSQALLNWSTENQYDMGILDAVLRQNRNMKTNNA
jgi:UDPglucose 6-dehydrogenase